MKKHFVTFYSPGTFIAETTELPIDSWDIQAAKKIAKTIHERHGAVPYGFRFSTRERNAKELDSKVVKESGMYYINCKVETLEQIKARNDPKESILISNMKSNKWDKVITTTKGWRWTQPLQKGDLVV